MGRSARPASAPPRASRARRDTWEGWEDSAVPPDRLGDYLRDLRGLFEEFGYAGETGPASTGTSARAACTPASRSTSYTADGIATYRALPGAGRRPGRRATAARSPASTATGSRRGELLPKMFGPEVIEAFGQVKASSTRTTG